jgi:hypothetical protein
MPALGFNACCQPSSTLNQMLDASTKTLKDREAEHKHLKDVLAKIRADVEELPPAQ